MAAPQKQTQKVGGFEFVAGGRRGPSTARQPTASSNEAAAPSALPGTGKRARKDYSDREDDELEKNAGGSAKFAKIADEDEEAGSVAVGEPDFSALVAEGSNSTERLRSLLSSALRISLAHLEANGHPKPDQAIVSAGA